MSIVERRFTTSHVGVRTEAGARSSTPTRTLHGYAAVFGTEAVIGGAFREVIAPGAFDEALRRGDDVRALVDHNPSLIIGRLRSKTLSLSVDRHGLRYVVALPATSTGHDIAELVSRGDVSQSSFGFLVERDLWTPAKTRSALPLRTVLSVTLVDVSPVSFPAYTETSVTVSPDALARAADVDADGWPARIQRTPEQENAWARNWERGPLADEIARFHRAVARSR